MPARSFRLDAKISNRVTNTINSISVDAVQSLPVIVTPAKPSRIRKQTVHYNPLEENKKPQHTQSTKTPTKNSKNTNNCLTVPKSLEVVKEEKEPPLILTQVSKELLCHHCNVGGDLMQCHHHVALGGGMQEIGCGKVVHSFCVGREEIWKGGWICTTCSNHHGFKQVKLPKELRNMDFADYGHEFIVGESSSTDDDDWGQQLEEALTEWKPKITTSSADKFEWQPTTLFGSLSGDEEITEDDDGGDSCTHHHSAVGPCDICKDEGDLIRCRSQLTGIGCGKGVHMYCVFREEVPEGDWVCEDCARHNNLKLDNKYPAMGYEYPVADLESIPKGEDTFEWTEGLGYRIQVGSRIGVYDEEDDGYENGTVEYKDACSGVFHLLFDDGERKLVDLRNRRTRLLSEKETISHKELQLKMRLSLDPSLPNYIICGGGVTKAHDRKHAHRLLEHYVDVFLDDDIAGSWHRGGSDDDFMCQQVLDNLKDNDIDFIQWDATIGGFGKASKKEITNKITSTIGEKRMERAQMPRGHIQPPILPQDNGPILHVLLVNGGRPQPTILRKRVSDDPFLAMQRAQERHRRNCARESGIISMQCATQDELAESASALLQLHQQEVVRSDEWDGDIFDDAPEEKSEYGRSAKAPQLSPPQRLLQRDQKAHKRKETMPEVIATRIKPPVPTTSSPTRKMKRVRTPSEKNSKQPPPSKKLKAASKSIISTNSTKRAIHIHRTNVDKWQMQMRKAASFRMKHGHCNIPSAYPPDPTLATWAKRQRHQYQLFRRQQNKCTMTPERIEALDAIDFCFDSQQIKWLQRFQEIKAYREKHGHTLVTTSANKGDQQLGAWVKHQRAQRKQFDKGATTFLTPGRIKMLESIDFIWHARPHKPTTEPVRSSTDMNTSTARKRRRVRRY